MVTLRRIGIVVLLLVLLQPATTLAAEEFPDVSSIAVVVYDADFGLTLYEKNPHQRRSIASLTKIMTILYTSELVQSGKIGLQDTVKASANAASRGGTEIELKAGDEFTVDELLYATALQSANDGAVALAEHIGGSERQFAALMTSRAQELGLTNTNFVDSTGLLSIYSGNYSTAYEVSILSAIGMNNELFAKYVSTKEYELQPQDRVIKNTNPFLNEIEGVDGVKTGATTPAGHCLVTSAVISGRRAIITVLGAPSRKQRNAEAQALLEWVYSTLVTLVPSDTVLANAVVRDGVSYAVPAVPSMPVAVFAVNEGDEDVTYETRVQQDLRAPLDAGDKVGDVIVYRSGEELARIDLIAKEGTGVASFFRRIYHRIIGFFDRLF